MYRVITQSWSLSQVCSWVLAMHCTHEPGEVLINALS